MKNIKNYILEKYSNSEYEKVEDGIYKTNGDPKICNPLEKVYVTSLSFEQEPELGEGIHQGIFHNIP